MAVLLEQEMDDMYAYFNVLLKTDKIAILDKPLYFYRLHGQNNSMQPRAQLYYEVALICKHIAKLYAKHQHLKELFLIKILSHAYKPVLNSAANPKSISYLKTILLLSKDASSISKSRLCAKRLKRWQKLALRLISMFKDHKLASKVLILIITVRPFFSKNNPKRIS